MPLRIPTFENEDAEREFAQLRTRPATSTRTPLTASCFRTLNPLIVLLLMMGFVSAQNAECPEAELIMPSRYIDVEQEAVVVLRIVGEFGGSVDWTVSSGTILNGRGSQVLTLVPAEDDQGTTIKVSAKLMGLPSNCSVEASDLLPVAQLPIREPVDILGKIGKSKMAKRLFQSRLDLYISALSQSTDYEGLVLVSFEASASRSRKIDHINLILDQVKFRNMDPSRITFYITEGEPQESTTLWTAFPGARIPKYMRTLPTIKGEEFERNASTLFLKTK